MSLSSLTGTQTAAVASVLQEPADKFENDAMVELMWAVKAHRHAETYQRLLSSVQASSLRLTKIDDQLYSSFRSHFTQLDINRLDVDLIKSAEGKERWREFCNLFEGQVEDWNMATLLRIDASGDVSEENSVIVPRIQFLAIEVARNREGCNNAVSCPQTSDCHTKDAAVSS